MGVVNRCSVITEMGVFYWADGEIMLRENG